MKIAVISDMHVGNASRAKDYSIGSLESKAIDDNYQETFLNFINTNSIEADFLLMPGDLSNSSRFDEIKLGSQKLFEIASCLKVPTDRIIGVPGNHDVDWSVLRNFSGEELKARMSLRFSSLEQPESLFKLRFDHDELLKEPYFKIWNYEDTVVVGCNSCLEDSPDEKIHHGLIRNETIKAIEEKLRESSVENKVKIFMIHHHPINYSDPIIWEDYSIMVNSENLISMLVRNSFDFLIHGHKHIPKFKIHREDSSYPLNILSSGSFAALLHTKLAGYVNNQFHLIEIDGRDPNKNINGKVLSWTYLSQRGWFPSNKTNGINHVMPFGADVHPEQIKKQLESEIQEVFKTKDFCKIKDLEVKLDFLKYLPHTTLINALSALESKLNFDIHETDKHIILLKK